MLDFFKKKQIFNLDPHKIDVLDYAFTRFEFESFADLGGVWGIEGAYSFHLLNSFNIKSANMVDTHPTSFFNSKAKKFKNFKVHVGDFGDKKLCEQVGNVDVVILFSVLLHQVSPNWDDILEMYSSNTKCFIIFNEQWLKSAKTVRLLDLGKKEYFENVPHVESDGPYQNLFEKLDIKHPDHNKTWRDVHHIWQWGITNLDLNSKLESLGFKLQYQKNCRNSHGLKNFHDYAFVFTK